MTREVVGDLAEIVAQGRRGEALLRAGHYAEGFRLYDQAWRAIAPGEWRDLPIPRWRGEDLVGRRFLICGEQGFGDQIMLARFAVLLQAQGAEILWRCEPPLRRLMAQSLGFLTEAGEETADFYCPSGALPLLFFPPLTEPPAQPYVPAPAARPVAGARIGVVTRGDPLHVHDAVRSMPDEIGARLLGLPGATSLRPQDSGAEDFFDTAALISALDLVITVDTSVAHLAGAMGRPVWILLSAVWSDWRWMAGRPDSPWYPTARLFRQATPGDWDGVIETVRRELGA